MPKSHLQRLLLYYKLTELSSLFFFQQLWRIKTKK